MEELQTACMLEIPSGVSENQDRQRTIMPTTITKLQTIALMTGCGKEFQNGRQRIRLTISKWRPAPLEV
ncbi:MAG: hypothetical protein ACTXOO_01825 [Sodalis sp. (in: enterobacteria)]